MSSIVFVWLRRAFDLACAISGLALLMFLGPWMLLTAATSHVPEPRELVRLDGVTAACRPVIGGIRLLLEGYDSEFKLPFDSCIGAQVDLARSAHVALNVGPVDLQRGRPRTAIPGFGLEVDRTVVHTVRSDLMTARLDRVILTITGTAGSATLLWLACTAMLNRAGLVKLLIH
jgi:hypothetical protein